MRIRRVRVNDQDKASIRCPKCDHQRRVSNVSQQATFQQPVTITCPCGYEFSVAFERRRLFRRYTILRGLYSNRTKPGAQKKIIIQDLSLGGVGFKTEEPHEIKVSDRLLISYTTEAPERTIITRRVVVRRVKGLVIGTEFIDTKPPDR